MAFHSVSDSQVSVRIYFNIFLLVIWASCYNASMTGREGGQVISQTVLAKVGDDVVLPCHVKSTNLESADSTLHNVEWTRRDLKPLYVHVLQSGRYKFDQMNPLYKQRTALFHERFSHGNVSLKLFRVQLSDEGKFKCLVPPNISGSLIQLLVGAVSQPKISFIGPKYEDLSCDSGCWYPEPEVSWLDSEGNHINDQSPMIKTSSTDSPNCYFVQRTVAVRRGKNITCRVNLPHINYTTTIETPEEPQASTSGAESTGPNGGMIAGMVLLVASILMLMGYFYWKKKQTGKQEDKNKAAQFVMQHKEELILKVSKVIKILNRLGPMVTIQLYGEIKEEKTIMDQMMRLYREILQPGGVEAKAAFHDALKEYEPKLFKTLEDPATPRPKDLWSQWKSSPVLCGGKDTQLTQGTEVRPGSDAGEQSLTKNAQFVKKNRAQLIQHVSRVMAILDSQEVQTRISPELRTKIEAQKARRNKMRTLYTAMEGDKDLFYKVLKKHEPHLLECLENPPTRDAVDLTPEEKARFVEENRNHLITYVSKVMAILDNLDAMVHPEIYDEIQEEETSMDQMWILYRQILDPAGTNVRAAFYNALKVHQPYLLKILDEEKVNHGDVSIDMTGTDPQALELAPLLSSSTQTVGSSGPEGENPPPGSNVEKEKDPEGDPPPQTGSDFEKGKDPEGDLPSPTGSDFEKGKATEPGHVVSQLDLNRREKMVIAIQDVLSTEDVTVQNMRKLEILDSRLAKDIFHKGFKDLLEKWLLDNRDPPCWTSLKELDDKKFQIFKLYLQDSKNLEGLEPLPESLLQNTDRMKTASLIMQTYHSEEDQNIITNVLEKIKQNDQEMLPDESTPEASAYHFVTQYRNDLVKRVKMIDPILDLLLAEGVITPEGYRNVMSKPTTMEKMDELYTLLDSRRFQKIFYSGLQEHERFLLDDLKHPPWIIDALKELDENEFKDFKSCLQQSDNLEGLQSLPKSLLENTDRTDTANLIVKTYGSKGSTIVMNVLKKINKNDLKSLPKGLEGVNPPSGSEKEKDPESLTESGIDKRKGPKLKLKGLPMQHFQMVSFVDKEKDSLIKRVTKVKPILDLLFEKTVISDAERSDMMAMPKTVDQMKKLYALLNDKDNVTKAKTTFYKGLQDNEKDLLKNL